MSFMRSVLAISAVALSVACGAPPTQQNTQAPPFDLPNLARDKTSLTSFQNKVVVMDF